MIALDFSAILSILNWHVTSNTKGGIDVSGAIA